MSGRRSGKENTNLFRGFLSGDAFLTKKGRRGTKMDSMWSRYMMDAFDTDDKELALIALESVLADLGQVVSGGEHGSAFTIGDYGFFSEKQFSDQAAILSQAERSNITGTRFLSESQWQEVDKKLENLAAFSSTRFKVCESGDTFLYLALRKCAFGVAQVLLEEAEKRCKGELDPLRCNEAGEDVMAVLAAGYEDLGHRLRQVQAELIRASEVVLLSEETQMLEQRINECKEQLIALGIFADALLRNFQRRQVQIEADVRKKRFNELRALPVSSDVIWNIAQLDKCIEHQIKCTELHGHVNESYRRLEQCLQDHVCLADVVSRRHRTITAQPEQPADLPAASDNGESQKPVPRRKQRNQKQKSRRRKQPTAGTGNDLKDEDEVGDSAVTFDLQPSPPAAQADAVIADKSEKDTQDEARLALVYKTKSASESKKEIYARAGLKMETAEDYSPILGTLYQSQYELIQYR